MTTIKNECCGLRCYNWVADDGTKVHECSKHLITIECKTCGKFRSRDYITEAQNTPCPECGTMIDAELV